MMTALILFFKRIIGSEYLALLLRLYLGFLFIYASMGKIPYAAEFAEFLASYRIAPYWSVNFLAVVLPWMEFVCGLFLIIGLRTRAVTIVLSLLLVMFTVAILVNLIRGMAINCGCFSNAPDTISWWHIPRDLLWLLFAAQIFFYDRISLLRRKGFFIRSIKFFG